jgi:hypothetical protein
VKDKGAGQYKLLVKAKGWFTAAAANQMDPDDTQLTVTVGTQCYTRAAMTKID